MPAPALSDAALTDLLGPMCPDCGWRGGKHRPPIALTDTPACPRTETSP